jgi:1-acyl-sn-glycerol-3-phosphate acyltransferase
VESYLKDGITMQIYPEGTRNKEGHSPKIWKDIKQTLLLRCYDLKLPLYPVCIDGGQHIMRKSILIYPGVKLKLFCLKPVDPNHYSNAQEFAQAAWNAVVETYAQEIP